MKTMYFSVGGARNSSRPWTSSWSISVIIAQVNIARLFFFVDQIVMSVNPHAFGVGHTFHLGFVLSGCLKTTV